MELQEILKKQAKIDLQDNETHDKEVAKEVEAIQKQIDIDLQKQEAEILKLQQEEEVLFNTIKQEVSNVDKKIQEDLEKQEKEDAIDAISDEPTNSELDPKLKKDLLTQYPNKTSLSKLKESEIVDIGKLLSLEVDLSLTLAQNKKIVINYFKEYIWN